MKFRFSLYCCFWTLSAVAQAADSVEPVNTVNDPSASKPEIFTNGFIDILNNGQVNASTRFIRLFIGEPGKFSVPLSFYSGVSANNFQNQNLPGGQRTNDHLVSSYINPLSGMLNVSSDAIIYFQKKCKPTRAGILYYLGERILTGYKTGSLTDPQTGRPVNFINGFATAGIYFQTAAWERSNEKNSGLFWMTIRYHGCYTNPDQLSDFLNGTETNGIYLGYSLGFGIGINNLLDMKVIYYRYTKAPEIDYSLPVYQFSFNYSLRNG